VTCLLFAFTYNSARFIPEKNCNYYYCSVLANWLCQTYFLYKFQYRQCTNDSRVFAITKSF